MEMVISLSRSVQLRAIVSYGTACGVSQNVGKLVSQVVHQQEGRVGAERGGAGRSARMYAPFSGGLNVYPVAEGELTSMTRSCTITGGEA